MSMKIIAATAVALSLLGGLASAQSTTPGERQAGAALFDQGGVFDKARKADVDTAPTASIAVKAPAKSAAVPADSARNESGQGMDLNR